MYARQRLTNDVPTLTIGSRVWFYDPNRRDYARDSEGKRVGAPLLAGSFVERWIVGERGASWLIARKQDEGPASRGVERVAKELFLRDGAPWYTDVQREDAIWLDTHQQELIEYLRTAPIDVMRRVAAVVDEVPAA